MDLPKKCTEKILKLYPNDAEYIIQNTQELLDKIINKYSLRNIEILDTMSYNLIIYAYSNTYKDVVVKIGLFKDSINREAEFYNIYEKNENLCKIYEANKEYIILKRVMPALKLDTIESACDRIKVYKKIWVSLDKEANNGSSLPNYKEIFYKAIENFHGDFLENGIYLAKKFITEIDNMNLKKYVLHGDLHHWNIIFDGDRWKIIDPARLHCGKGI